MAGLVVIDFIDMEQSSHIRKVEKAMKDALKNDRARIQVGRISSFGLMEMSRQRLRTGVLEASTRACPHCEGTGLMRTAARPGLSALRIIEDEAARGRGDKIVLRAGREAAVYVLNKKRAELADIEQRYGVSIEVVIDETFEGARMTVESSGPRPVPGPRAPRRPPSWSRKTTTGRGEDRCRAGRRRGRRGNRGARRRGARVRARRSPGPQARRRRGGRGRSRRDEEGGQPRERAPEAETELPAAEASEEVAEVGSRSPPKAARAPAARAPRRARRLRVAADSSPMIERPLAEEPAIAETEAESRGRERAAQEGRAEGCPAGEPKWPKSRRPKRPQAEPPRKGSKAAKAEQAAEAGTGPRPRTTTRRPTTPLGAPKRLVAADFRLTPTGAVFIAGSGRKMLVRPR